MSLQQFKSVFRDTLFLIVLAMVVLFIAEIYLRHHAPYLVTQTAAGARVDEGMPPPYRFTLRGRRLLPRFKGILLNHPLSKRDILLFTNSLGFRNRELAETRG